jgi:hypothetical protein
MKNELLWLLVALLAITEPANAATAYSHRFKCLSNGAFDQTPIDTGMAV